MSERRLGGSSASSLGTRAAGGMPTGYSPGGIGTASGTLCQGVTAGG